MRKRATPTSGSGPRISLYERPPNRKVTAPERGPSGVAPRLSGLKLPGGGDPHQPLSVLCVRCADDRVVALPPPARLSGRDAHLHPLAVARLAARHPSDDDRRGPRRTQAGNARSRAAATSRRSLPPAHAPSRSRTRHRHCRLASLVSRPACPHRRRQPGWRRAIRSSARPQRRQVPARLRSSRIAARPPRHPLRACSRICWHCGQGFM